MNASQNVQQKSTGQLSLIREEVLERQRTDIGESLNFVPVSVNFLTCFFVATAIAVVAFLLFFDYARRVKVSGKLMATEGVVRLYPPIEGIVTKRFVGDGDYVEKGQPLFAITADKRATSVGNIADGVVRQLKKRSETIAEDEKRVVALRSREKTALIEKIRFLEIEQQEIEMQIGAQKKAVATSGDYIQKFRELAKQNFVSESLLQEKEQANIETQTRLHGLLRDASTVAHNLQEAKTELANFPEKVANELSALHREVATLEQDTFEYEGRREIIVYASISGTITGILVDPGQYSAANQVLGSIVPANAQYYLRLNIPTAAAGLVKSGQSVSVRYSSFPYQRFGQFEGRILSVSRTALSSVELKVSEDVKELYYPAYVELSSQVVTAYGESIQLREGMLADADILLEKRKLIEWVIEPLLAARSRYIAPAAK